MGKEVQDDTVLLPGKTDHTPCTGPDHMNDYVQRVDVQGMQTDRGQNSESAEIFQISHKYYLKDILLIFNILYLHTKKKIWV